MWPTQPDRQALQPLTEQTTRRPAELRVRSPAMKKCRIFGGWVEMTLLFFAVCGPKFMNSSRYMELAVVVVSNAVSRLFLSCSSLEILTVKVANELRSCRNRWFLGPQILLGPVPQNLFVIFYCWRYACWSLVNVKICSEIKLDKQIDFGEWVKITVLILAALVHQS